MSGLSNFLGDVYGEDDDSADDPDNPPAKSPDPDQRADIPEQDQRLEPSLSDVRDSMEALLADAEPVGSPESPPVTWAETISASELEEPPAMSEAVGSPDPPENPTDDWFSGIDGPPQVPEAIPIPDKTPMAAAETASTAEPIDQEGSEPHLPSFLEEVGRTEIDNSWLDEIEESPELDETIPETITEDPAHVFVEEEPARLPEPPVNELTSNDFQVPDLPTDVDDDQPWIDELLLGSEPESTEDDTETQATADHPMDPLGPESPAPTTPQDPEHSSRLDPLGDSQPVLIEDLPSHTEDLPTPTEDEVHAAPTEPDLQMAPIPVWSASRDDIIPGQEMQTFHRPMVTPGAESESGETPMAGIEGLPAPGVPKERRGRRRGRRKTEVVVHDEPALDWPAPDPDTPAAFDAPPPTELTPAFDAPPPIQQPISPAVLEASPELHEPPKRRFLRRRPVQ